MEGADHQLLAASERTNKMMTFADALDALAGPPNSQGIWSPLLGGFSDSIPLDRHPAQCSHHSTREPNRSGSAGNCQEGSCHRVTQGEPRAG